MDRHIGNMGILKRLKKKLGLSDTQSKEPAAWPEHVHSREEYLEWLREMAGKADCGEVKVAIL